MQGIIDPQQNLFAKPSWIEQGYSLTPDRQALLPILFKRTVKEIKVLKDENYCSYPAFLAIRWGFAFLRNNVFLPSYKWNHKEYYDGYGQEMAGYGIPETVARWENEFNVKIFKTYDQASALGYSATYFLRKIRNDGGIKSAKHWLNPSYDSESQGFIKLKEMRRLDISLEALVLRYPFYKLFLNEELNIARSRLIKAGYNGAELYDEIDDGHVTEEIRDPDRYPEGAKHQVTVNAFERNPEARRKCIEFYGTTCSVCGFNFGSAYGPEFKDFIHIHHLVPLSHVGANYVVDPIKDLRPVCPNCHAVIHRKNPPYTMDQVKGLILKLL